MIFNSFSDVAIQMRGIYPAIKQFCGKSNVSAPTSARVQEIIEKFFSNPVIMSCVDRSILDRFVPTLLQSSPRIQRIFINTYILKDPLGAFTRRIEHGTPQVGAIKDLSIALHQFLGVTDATLKSGFFSRSNYFEQMYGIMSSDVRIKDYLEGYKFMNPPNSWYDGEVIEMGGGDQPNVDKAAGGGADAPDIIDARNSLESKAYIERIAKSFLKEYFPGTQKGVSFPVNIDKVIKGFFPKPAKYPMQEFIKSLIKHINQQGVPYILSDDLQAAYAGRFYITSSGEIFFQGLNGKLKPEEADAFLKKFIIDNKKFLKGFKNIEFSGDGRLITLPEAMRELDVESITLSGKIILPTWIQKKPIKTFRSNPYTSLKSERILPVIRYIKTLEELDVSGAQLRGKIPGYLGNLPNLRKFNLSENQLTGLIPTELGRLSKLEELDLSENQLTGPIPTELGSLVNLRVLNLIVNRLDRFIGAIPTELGGFFQDPSEFNRYQY